MRGKGATHKDQRKHRRRVSGTKRGKIEHEKRKVRRKNYG